MSGVRRASFVVRAVQDERGDVSGVVERVATGAKEVFCGMEAIGLVIGKMLHEASALPRPGSSSSPASGEKPAPDPIRRHGSVRNAAGRRTNERER
jgi:hypothetical protein